MTVPGNALPLKVKRCSKVCTRCGIVKRLQKGKGAVCSECQRKPYRRHRKDACESCGWKPPTIKVLEVDHIVAKADGGTDDPANLRTLCPNCHRLKTLAERGLLG